MNSGIYTITAPSGRFYVGSAVHFDRRWRVHLHRLRAGTHHNKPLQAAWSKYGDKLVFKPIIICSQKDTVFYEQRAIDGLNPQMNVCRVAGKTLGYVHTDETKEKFHLRKKSSRTQEQIAAHREAMRRPLSPDNYARLLERVRIRKEAGLCKMKPETIEKLRSANAGRKFGPMSGEHKAKIGAANKGRKPSASCIAASIASRSGNGR